MQKAYKLLGKHMHYDWGGHEFIPHLMGVENTENKPFAEYWMGVHPAAVAEISMGEELVLLDHLIAMHPTQFLGEKINTTFGTLPYLFKILDVAKMLSIQAHPNQQNAEQGYAKEQAAGININALNRNYKDKNHKPEVMVALSEFWLLHGFLSPTLLEERLNEFFYFKPMQEYFKGGDYEGLYQFFMQLTSTDADLILKPLMADAVLSVKNGSVDKTHPHWWANQYYQGVVPQKNIDKGIFTIYILNIVHLSKFQGIFQGAGLLHAYLEGQNIELMANSDNVLRGGLTTKHVDVAELIQQVKFIPTDPQILNGDILNEFETLYPCPVKDFGLTKIAIPGGQSYTINTRALEILLVMEGELQVDKFKVKAGESVLLTPGHALVLKAISACILFKSFVP